MRAAGGVGRAVYVAQYLSFVISGPPGNATVRPLLTDIESAQTRLSQGVTLSEQKYVELLRARIASDIAVPSSSPAIESPHSEDATSPFTGSTLALIGLAFALTCGLLFVAFRVWRRRAGARRPL